MSNVSQLDIRDEVFTAFAAAWAGASPIAFPNVDFDRAKVTGNAYVSVDLNGAPDGEVRYSHSIARNHFSRAGTLTVTAFVRTGRDTDEAYTLLDAAVAFMENPGTAVPTAIFGSIGTPVVLGSDGAFWSASVSAEVLYFTDRAA